MGLLLRSVTPPLRVDYGCNVFIGDNFYCNFDCVRAKLPGPRCSPGCFLPVTCPCYCCDFGLRGSSSGLAFALTVVPHFYRTDSFRGLPLASFLFRCAVLVDEHWLVFFVVRRQVILDCAKVTIGDNVLLGPGVQLYAATHPTNPTDRDAGRDFAFPITLGDGVWVGGRSIINPGVTVGDHSVIGAGSVVTRDVPPNVVAAGAPAMPIKPVDGLDEASEAAAWAAVWNARKRKQEKEQREAAAMDAWAKQQT